MEFANKLQEITGKDYLSYSSIKHALNDMKLFELYMAGKLKKESAALSFGSVYDMLLFEPDKFDEQFVVFDDSEIIESINSKNPRVTKIYKDWKSDFLKEIGNREMVLMDDYQMALDMISRLEDTGIIDQFMKGNYQEEFNEFIDDIPVRGFFDCNGENYVTDSKSTRSINGFRYDVPKFGYDIQAYIYKTVSGKDDFYWVAQEKAYPYLPGVYRATDATLQRGHDKFWKAVSVISEYLDANKSTELFYIVDEI
jgi:hypothetical protein